MMSDSKTILYQKMEFGSSYTVVNVVGEDTGLYSN